MKKKLVRPLFNKVILLNKTGVGYNILNYEFCHTDSYGSANGITTEK